MSSSDGKKGGRYSKPGEPSFLEDEESVLVASPFAYVTPPMPPRDQVSNTKTTKAMAKIVEEEGTPDSVIRKLSFVPGLTHSLSSPEDRRVPGTVNRASRVKSLDGDSDEDGFRFPSLSPDADTSKVDLQDDSSSDGFSRLSLSMVDLDPPNSPKPLRALQPSRTDSGDQGTVPDILCNCASCGKQFISEKNLKDHYQFCRSDARGRVGYSEASTLAQTTDRVLASIPSVSSSVQLRTSQDSKAVNSYAESPELRSYLQRAHSLSQIPSPLPSVAPPPLSASPSILASPTELVLRNSNEEEEFLEGEISTFLECLRSDVEECSESAKWASRRARIGRVKSEHSLCVSSEEDDEPVPLIIPSKTGLVLAPAAPPLVPMSSNIYSPIPQRSSFDQESSMTTSFLAPALPVGSPCSPIVATKLPSVSESLEDLRTSPTFGRLSMRSSMTPSVTDSSVTFALRPIPDPVPSVRTSQRVACKCCGRKFATPARLERHEAICEQVFGRPKFREEVSNISTRDESSAKSSSLDECLSCKHCGRSFNHTDKLSRHEHVCLSVFRGRRQRSKSPRSMDSSFEGPGTAMRRARCDSSSFENRHLRMHQFTCAIFPPSVRINRGIAIGTQTSVCERPVVKGEIVHRSFSSDSGTSRSSLEFQYQLLRDQIRTCSEKLKQRRCPAVYRDA